MPDELVVVRADQTAAWLAWCHWFVIHQPQIGYTQDGRRMAGIGHPGMLPLWCDCSSTLTIIDNWCGLADPNQQTPPYNGVGDTETLPLGAIAEVADATSRVGDKVIYGLGGPLEHQHCAGIVSPGPNPMTMSHGWGGEPAFVPFVDGDPTGGAYGPPRFFRYSMVNVYPVAYPPGFKKHAAPGSIASRVPNRFLPAGPPPDLIWLHRNPQEWVDFWRLCMIQAGVTTAEKLPPFSGGYGRDTRNTTVRFQRRYPDLAPNGKVTGRVWEKVFE